MPSYWYHHVHLYSPDALKTAEFYEKMFAAKKVATRKFPDGHTSITLDVKGSKILVTEPAPGSAAGPSGLEHFGMETDDIEAAVADLKAQGAKFRDEITEVRPGLKIAYL